MAEKSCLRRRIIEDMTVRNLSPATQRSYPNAISKFSRYFGRSLDHLGLEESMRSRFILWQRDIMASAQSNCSIFNSLILAMMVLRSQSSRWRKRRFSRSLLGGSAHSGRTCHRALRLGRPTAIQQIS
jgi:hypothetical protein